MSEPISLHDINGEYCSCKCPHVPLLRGHGSRAEDEIARLQKEVDELRATLKWQRFSVEGEEFPTAGEAAIRINERLKSSLLQNNALIAAMREALMRPDNWREALNTALNDLDPNRRSKETRPRAQNEGACVVCGKRDAPLDFKDACQACE